MCLCNASKLTPASSIEGLLSGVGIGDGVHGSVSRSHQDLLNKIIYAFQLASAHGPLCSEPLEGVAVFLEEFSLPASKEGEETAIELSGQITGEIIRMVRDFIRQGFLDWSPRMLLAMYKCEIQASSKCRVLPAVSERY